MNPETKKVLQNKVAEINIKLKDTQDRLVKTNSSLQSIKKQRDALVAQKNDLTNKKQKILQDLQTP